jgi:hypothetical protein
MEGYSETCKICGMAGGHTPECPANQPAEETAVGPEPDAEPVMSDEEYEKRAAEAAALLGEQGPEAKEIDTKTMAAEMVEEMDAFVEARYAYVSGDELGQGLAEMLSSRAREIAAGQGLELSEEQAEEMVDSLGIDDKSGYAPSDLPEHLQGPEDGTNFLTVRIGGQPVVEVSSMGDGYGASLDEFDESVVQRALNSLAERISQQAKKA